MTATWSLTGRALEVKIDGRVTVEAIEAFGEALRDALDRPGPFTVCFDRSTMTAVTKDGRVALEHWAGSFLPQLPGRCIGWADVYDHRRMTSLTNAAGGTDQPDETVTPPYPQRLFDDLAAARSWLSDLAGGTASSVGPTVRTQSRLTSRHTR